MVRRTQTTAVMTLRWRVPPGEAQPLMATLQRLMVSTRSEPGCDGCFVSSEMGERTVLHYAETWRTEEDLKCHLRSDGFASLAEVMERASVQPRVTFTFPAGIRGLDYAKEVLRSAGH